MKKKLLYLLLLFGMLFCIKINVNAKEILSSDISPRTYVIGTHEFTESTTLSTKHIMLASKTIVGDTLDDMIIYYKNPRGKWINGLTGEIVEVSEKFNIEYVDLVKELEKPTLTLVRISGTYGYLSISEEGYYSDEDHMNQISGWEVYEKTDNGYARVYGGDETEYYISLKEGEEKNFVAIAYKLTSTLDKKYSAYSNEVGMIGKKLALPTLTKVSETADEVVLSFVKEGNYTTAESLDHITGWSLYLTNSESIEDDLIKEGAYNETTITLNKSELPDKDNLELYLIVYLDHEEDRYTIYSDSSNIVMVTKNNLQTPTLTATYTTDKTTVELSIIKEGAYNSSNIENSIDGWELYEKTESGYKLEVEGEFNAFGMPTSSISGKTYIARVYKLNSSSNKIYSDYSNEITIEDVVNMPKMPTLANLKTEGRKTILSIAKTGYYKDNANISDIAGWELYEINELGYHKVGSSEKSEIEITISKDETKAYAARTFKTSSNGNVYSNYSTGLVVTGKFINAPILSITYKKGTEAILSINEDGYYSDPNNLKEITGLELWKVEKNESTGEVINTSKVEGCEALTECAIEISYNHSDEYFARVYNIDKNNYEVYSEASNNLEVEAELSALVLKNISNDNSYAKLSAVYEDNEISQSISGYEFYEKTTSGYAKLYEGTNNEYNIYDLIPNISRTFIVKSYILEDSNKIYSNSSNELVITRDKVETPTLTETLGDEESVSVAINTEGYYKEKEENIKAISGWELYEVENSNYTKISDVERDKDYTVNLTVGKSITLSSRTYITNPTNNERVYSDYSNEITIENEVETTAFENDSWETIISNVKAGNINNYQVGDTKEVDLGDYGTHTIRIANTSTPNECSIDGFSQTACGFVLEFADIITKHTMNDTYTNVGGWPATSMRTFVNSDIYNLLPSELKTEIIDTTVVSGHGKEETTNFTSVDKLYLLSPKEIYKDFNGEEDTTITLTRQLDYYEINNITTSNRGEVIKKINNIAGTWHLRTAAATNYSSFFNVADNGGLIYGNSADHLFGVSPAFRIG